MYQKPVMFRPPKNTTPGKLTLVQLPLLYLTFALPVSVTPILAPAPTPPIGTNTLTEPTGMLLAESPSMMPKFRIPKRAHGKLTIL